MLEIFFYSYFTSIYLFSAGIFFSTKILNLNLNLKTNFFQSGLYGVIFISFLALFINFFFELNKNINTIIYSFFFIHLFFFQKKIIKKILIISITTALICSLLLVFETTYRPDAGLYHLPYTNILNNEKIIIGLSNIHFRYGHTSIIQYLSAINNNWIFNDKGIVIPLSIIFSYFLLYLIHEIKNENNKIIIFFNFIIIAFLCLKLNRYSDFGNDAPAHIFYFFLISVALKSFEHFNKKNMGELLTVAAYIVFNKITLFLSSLIPIIILLFKKKINLFNFKIIFFLALFLVSFFVKNFLVSGCFAFPIEKTCITKIFWYDSNSNRGSNAKMTMLENEAWTKGWSDQKDNRKNFEEYLSNLDWIKLWSKHHGKRTLNKLLPFLFFLIIISSVIFNLGANKKNANFKHNISLNNKIFLVFLTINVLGTIMWFFKFPVFRYGSSYLISTIATFLTILCWNKIQLIDLLKLKKILGYFTVFLLIILVSKNTIRIVKNYGQIYNDSPWPKIYSETKYNEKNKNKPIYKNNKIAFYQSTTGLCYYNTAPCTHMLDSQFAEKDINLKNIFGYKIFYFLK
tara:strand:+ start:1709 stop:3424 length:1716 start_codon:yes stop_codon:yes gene_type:complete